MLSGILSNRAHHVNVDNHDDNDEDDHAEIDLGYDNDDGNDYTEEEGKVMMIIIATDGTAGCNGFVNSNSAWTLSWVKQNHNQHIIYIINFLEKPISPALAQKTWSAISEKNFWISVFLYFFGFLAISRERINDFFLVKGLFT